MRSEARRLAPSTSWFFTPVTLTEHKRVTPADRRGKGRPNRITLSGTEAWRRFELAGLMGRGVEGPRTRKWDIQSARTSATVMDISAVCSGGGVTTKSIEGEHERYSRVAVADGLARRQREGRASGMK